MTAGEPTHLNGKGLPAVMHLEGKVVTKPKVKWGRESLESLQVLEKIQRQSDARFRKYRVSQKPNISNGLRKKLELRAAQDLNSVNPISRIQVAISLFEKLESHFREHAVDDAYFVSLISEKHSVRASDRNGYDVTAHRVWIETVLSGMSYVGMIEPAYYPAVSFIPPANEDWISWHAHVVVWGTTAAALKDLKEIINESEDSFRLGGTVFHYRTTRPSRIEAEIAYMCKSPRSAYKTHPAKRMIIDPATRKRIRVPTGTFKQNKSELRPGKLLIVLSAMENLSIKQLLVSGGEGDRLGSATLLSAKRVLQEQQRLRDKALRSL